MAVETTWVNGVIIVIMVKIYNSHIYCHHMEIWTIVAQFFGELGWDAEDSSNQMHFFLLMIISYMT